MLCGAPAGGSVMTRVFGSCCNGVALSAVSAVKNLGRDYGPTIFSTTNDCPALCRAGFPSPNPCRRPKATQYHDEKRVGLGRSDEGGISVSARAGAVGGRALGADLSAW